MKYLSTFGLLTLVTSSLWAFDFSKTRLKSYECGSCSKLSRELLQSNWKTEPNPLKENTSNKDKSYSYFQHINSKDLQKGITFYTQAPAAILRISSLQRHVIPKLNLITSQNKTITLQESTSLPQTLQLKENELDNKKDKIIQLKKELGSGTFTLKSNEKMVNSNQQYIIHVYDKFSLIYLEITTDALRYQYGDTFSALITLKDNDQTYTINDINIYLVSPNGIQYPLNVSKHKHNQFEANTLLNSEENSEGRNWYIETEIFSEQDDATIRRTARTAFSYSIPSAQILSIHKINSNPLQFEAKVEISTASRYALQSVLLHKGNSNSPLPIELSQSGAWLEPGIHKLQFGFDNSEHLSEDTLSLGYFQITDYGQLKTVFTYNNPIKLTQFMD